MDSVTWRKNGVKVGPEFTQTQTLTDTVSATYQHTLSSDSFAEFVGSFTCEVRDAAGNTNSRTLNLNGEGVFSVIEGAESSTLSCYRCDHLWWCCWLCSWKCCYSDMLQ